MCHAADGPHMRLRFATHFTGAPDRSWVSGLLRTENWIEWVQERRGTEASKYGQNVRGTCKFSCKDYRTVERWPQATWCQASFSLRCEVSLSVYTLMGSDQRDQEKATTQERKGEVAAAMCSCAYARWTCTLTGTVSWVWVSWTWHEWTSKVDTWSRRKT